MPNTRFVYAPHRIAIVLGLVAASATSHAQVATGSLRVAVNRPNTWVQLDGATIGVAPVSLRVPVGLHRVRIGSPGFHAWEGAVTVDTEAPTRVRAWLRRVPGHADGWTTGAFGLAALTAAVLLGAVSWADHASLQSDLQAGVLDDRDPRIAQGQSFAIGADIAWGVTGVLAAVAVVLFVHDGSAPSMASVSTGAVRIPP